MKFLRIITIIGMFGLLLAPLSVAQGTLTENQPTQPPKEEEVDATSFVVTLEDEEEKDLTDHFSVRLMNRKYDPDITRLDDGSTYLLEFESEEKAEKAKEKYEKNKHIKTHHNIRYSLSESELKSSMQKLPLNDERKDQQTNLDQIRVREAWNYSKGAGSVVAVIDTGVDTWHSDLHHNVWRNSNEIPFNGVDDDHNGFIDDIDGWNFVENNNYVRPAPVQGQPNSGIDHGTHVAGIVAATANNYIGIAGAAPGAKIMSLKVLDHNGNGTTAELISAIYYAINHGADVINLSLTASTVDPALDAPIRAAYNAGVTVVAAMGNSGQNLDIWHISPTANDAGVNAVIGVTSVNGNNDRSGFTNYGYGADIAAPGEYITSTLFSQSEGYGAASGTSQATPHVSAVAAILHSQHPEWSAAIIRDQITSSANDQNGNFDQRYGQGILDALKAVNSKQENEKIAIIKQTHFYDQDVYIYNAPQGEEHAQETGKDLWEIPANNNIELATGCDIDGDGDKELAVMKNFNGDRDLLIYNTPEGTRPETIIGGDKWNIPSIGERIIAIAGGDFDGDKKCEIAVMHSDRNGHDYDLTIFHAPNGYEQASVYATDKWIAPQGNNTVAMAAGDHDGDGEDELYVLKNEHGDYNFYAYDPPQGTGHSHQVGADLWQIPNEGPRIIDIAGIDMDGDGKDEVAVLSGTKWDQDLRIYNAPQGTEHSTLRGWDLWNIPDGNNGIAIAGVR